MSKIKILREVKMQKNVKTLFILLVVVIGSMGTVSADSVNSTVNTTVLPNYSNIYVQTANDEGISFNTTGNGTYYIQSLSAPNGGFNAVHIANNSSATLNYGSYTTTSNQSGTFYATDTGGRGYQDDVILLVAVNGTLPDDFVLHVIASGYNWTPTGVMNAAPTTAALSDYGVTLNETFTKADFIYGPQDWKPTGGNANYPIYLNEDVNDTSNMFHLMFVDLHAGLLGSNYPGGNSQFVNNGAVKIDYSFENLASLAAFNIYAWNWNTSQGQGMLWTNSIKPGNTGGPSGYAVLGATSPVADFSSSTTTDPLTIQFTDKSTGAEPLSYLWNFGDGATSTDENPVHSYSKPGNYNVNLIVNNNYGSSEKTSSINATVVQVLADLSSGVYSINQTVNLTASDQSDPNPKIYYTLDGTDPTTNSTLYTGSIVLKEGTTILKFEAFDSHGYSSKVVTRNYTLDETPPTVTATPSGGTYNTLQNVTLTTTDATNTKTYYTTDGTDPKSSTTRTLYSSPIAVYINTLLEFAAVDAASNWSPVYIQNYTMVDKVPPVLSVDLPNGSYTSDQVVKLSAVDEMDPNSKIYYTLDGTDPTTNSTFYAWPISINIVGTTVLKAIAVDNAGNISDILTRIYALDKPPVSGTWNTTTLDSNSIYNSIVMDSSGNPHIAYYQNANSGTDYPKLKYAYRDSTGWHIETVDSIQSGAGYYVSLALDSLNNPYLVYKQEFGDGNTNMLKYAYKDANGWHYVVLATSYPGNTLGDDIVYIDMVMYHDQPRISFYNITGGELEYMYNNGTNWVTENVASTSAPWNSLAVDSSGNPKISYCSVSASSGKSSLRYAQRTADGTWQTKIVDNSADNVGDWNSLALDSSGNPWISYDYNDEELKYAYWNGTQWITGVVDTLAASTSKIVLTGSNSPLIIYRDDTSSNLKYAFLEGSKWSISNINSVDGAYLWISLALDASGVPNVSYMTSNSKLNYAYLVPFVAGADPAGGTFNTTQTVNLTSTPGTTVYYTTDGSDPRISSTKTKYSAPISVNNTTTIRFAAVDPSDNWSNIYTETYEIIHAPASNFTANVTNGTTPLTVQFTDESSNNPTSWLWDFGDGSTSTLQNPTHTYTNAGKYTVSLTTGNIAGNNTVTQTNYIVVSQDVNDPVITNVTPAGGATNLPVNQTITITFSKPISAGSAYDRIKVVTPDNKAKTVTKSISGNVLTITAVYNYTPGTYTVYIPVGAVTDLAGNNLSTAYSSNFTVVPGLTVGGVDTSGVLGNRTIVVTFSGDIAAGSAYDKIKVVTPDNKAKTVTKTIKGNQLIITGVYGYTAGDVYKLVIPVGAVTDLAGNNLSTAYTSNFTADTAPVVVGVDPGAGVNVSAVNQTVTVRFNEPISAGSAYDRIKVVTPDNKAKTVTKSISGNVLTITAVYNYTPGTYTVYIPADAVTDLAGNNLSTAYSSNFTVVPGLTVGGVDTSGVLGNRTIVVTFSGDIAAGSAYDRIKVVTPDNKAKTVTKMINGNQLIITAAYNYTPGTYTLSIPANSLTDSRGNAIAESYTKTVTV
jgi:PKD repeat protein